MKYSSESVAPYQFEGPEAQERHVIAMKEVAETILFTAGDGQRFSGIHVNRDFAESGNPVHIRSNSMFGDSKGADQRYIAYQEAAAFPDRNFVIIDQPAHGASDILTPSQLESIKNTGSLATVAAAQIEAVQDRLPEAKKAVFTGEALGARMAAELAIESAKRDLEPTHLFGFDTAGLENRSSALLGLGFLARVPKSRKLYEKGKANERLQESFEDFQEELTEYGPVHVPNARTEAGVWRRQRSLVTFLFRNSPLAKSHGLDAIEQNLAMSPGMEINLVFAGLSAIGRLKHVNQHLVDIKRNNQSRLHWYLWPNDDQGIGYAAHRPRLTAFKKDTLESK